MRKESFIDNLIKRGREYGEGISNISALI